MRRPQHDAHVVTYREFLAAYIRARSIPDDDSGCWIWRYCVNSRDGAGIPVASVPGSKRNVTVRKLAAFVAEKPLRQAIRTSCGERLCVAPAHMVPCTRAELARWMVRAGKVATGPTTSARKLASARARPHVHMTLEKARAIRARYAEVGNAKAVAMEFGIRHDHAHRIIRGQLWREPSPFAGLGGL